MNEKKSTFTNGIDALWKQAGKSPSEIRIQGMTDFKNMMLLGQVLFQRDAERLEKEHGKDHPRAKHIRARLKTQTKVVNNLEVELELAKVNVPAVPKGGALVHGRVTDGHNRGIVGLKITLEDEKEQILRFLGWSETDASGYYALILDSRKLKKLAELDGGYLVVSTPAGRIVHREPEVIKVEPSDRLVFAVTLNRADLSPIKPAETPQKDQENEDRSSPAEPTETIDTQIVQSQVCDASVNALAGATVSVYDKDLIFDDRIGTAFTDDEDCFQLI